MKERKLIKSLAIMLVLLFVSGSAYTGNINSDDKYAWGENVGWINFMPENTEGVTVTDSNLSGYAWGENTGLLNLDPVDNGVVNDGDGNLSGYAWGENCGWVNFDEASIDPCTGVFSGYIWSENIGWISLFTEGTPNKITTTWTKDSDGDGTSDCTDNCDNDASKVEPGDCGCGVAETDTDGDGTPDCIDNCDNDASKVEPGDCGCGVAETDTDGDGTPDCVETSSSGGSSSSSGGGSSCFISTIFK